MKKLEISKIVILLITTISFQSCIADLRTSLIKNEPATEENIQHGKNILEKAWIAQGFDKFEQHSVYTFRGTDNWQGIMGKMGKLWPDSQTTMSFKYEVGTFNGQIQFEDGKRAGDIVGFQNWNYYEATNGGEPIFQETDKRIGFGLPAFQYFTEMISRLRKAPIIRYAGENEMRNQKYDLVFCTWNAEKPHDEADQYVAWVNKNTGILDFVQFTIRENYLRAPGYKSMYGGIEFSDLREIDGSLVAFEQSIYMLGLKNNKEKYLHQLTISDFEFDNFNEQYLEIDTNIAKGGDFKE